MTNAGPGPWAFWIEFKGPKTPIRDDQVRIGYSLMAAGVPWFVVRHPDDLVGVLEELGHPPVFLQIVGTYDRETDVQGTSKKMLEAAGFRVIDTSQGFRPGGKRHATTRITRGTPDVFVWKPRRGGRP